MVDDSRVFGCFDKEHKHLQLLTLGSSDSLFNNRQLIV
uniref:Uncharacterized protein n=1 Tax=Rhizophora mucronata TaxID=61149 RepID=A0A2P2PGI5_RHIMU